MNFGLIIVGDEILSGKREDKHLPKVIDLLNARGLSLAWARYVGDVRERITADLRDAFAAARAGDVVFSCGGIGATPDDHTRQCAAAALDVPLELHPRAKDLILERMRDVAAEQGKPFDPDRADNVHRLNMGVFPQGAQIIPNPYNKIPGFSVVDAASGGGVFFVPGFPVMAWPMIEWVLDTHCRAQHRAVTLRERSVIVMGSMEATLTPLMEAIEARFPDVKVFSLPSVDHPQWGRHIELGVKGAEAALGGAFDDLLAGLRALNVELGPEMVR
ncbi:MAG: competence/damage-inducible protein A [Piscinibacter sp.]|uniref:competence/damage-inducible protein A n=1 Tax=Piscinibacter sp. TaxID=1903157 RepID=UPI0025907DDE|nr:molybdopterin-binding protein [Piscinibacter sp.]MCW5663070.1 competence/damage-inducible protein A [Piscinibacter sp.]